MTPSSQHVVNVTARDFVAIVIEGSRKLPVLVDFWAAWCGPCRALGPVLERLAAELNGAFLLAKVDTEASPELGAEFGIRGIPAVKLFRDGKVVDEFVGALPESQVRAFLRRHCPSPVEALVVEALDYAGRGYQSTAIERLQKALTIDAKHAGANLALARLLLVEGNLAAASEHAAAVPASAKEADEAEALRDAVALVQLGQEMGTESACRARLNANPHDLDARLGLGAALVAAGRYQEALDEFLAVVAQDKRVPSDRAEGAPARGPAEPRRDASSKEVARKAMITVFGLVGMRSELASSYRRKLTIYL